MIEKRNWDSNFFGYSIGVSYVTSTKEFNLKQLLDDSKEFKLTYVFSECVLPDSEKLMLIDKKVTWRKKCDYQDLPFNIQEFKRGSCSYEEILNLALLSGKFSRYRKDRNFKNNEFFRLYKEWLDQSIKKQIADKVFIYLYNNQIIGFITVGKLTEVTSQIGLISVDPKYQGLGIASKLIQRAINYSISKNYKKIQVTTQMDNLAAMKLYEKNKFKIETIQYIYHIWNQ
jgi:dTDP-4-amino-4,6-dideoxy-D-galactose acyltransferase